jgi:hypothetical protein
LCRKNRRGRRPFCPDRPSRSHLSLDHRNVHERAQRQIVPAGALCPCRTGPQARKSDPRRHQHFTSTLKTQKSPWLSIHNPRLFGFFCHCSTALSFAPKDSRFLRNSFLRPIRLFSHLSGRFGDRVSLSRIRIKLSYSSLTSYWKPFSVCMRAI